MKPIHVVLVLDRSGSMQGVVPVTIKGVNELFQTLKSVQRDTHQKITASLIGFESGGYGYIGGYGQETGQRPGHELIPGYEDVAIEDLKPVTTKEIYGGGGTEMNKAILFGIQQLSQKNDVLFLIFTDGATSDYNLFADAAKAITDKQSRGWTFAFVGANQNASEIAKKLSIPETNAMEYQSDALGTRSAFFKLSRGVRKYLEAQVNQVENGLVRFDNFFNDEDLQKSVMKVNGLTVTLNMPESVRSEDDDKANELPPYAPIAAHVVDEYPACPPNWKQGSALASSYFVKIEDGKGMWLDFNGNAENERDIAVVISVQGINPITGQKTSEMRLEKYEKCCPVHNEEFGQERFCKSCGFKWPSQNYLSTTGTPHGQFWLDGFRSPDGKVRQYVFSPEDVKGVAYNVLDKNKPESEHERVFAIGVAFFRSKAPKPTPYGGWMRGMSLGASLNQTMSLAGGAASCAMGPMGPTGPAGYAGPASLTKSATRYSQNRIADIYNTTDSDGPVVGCSSELRTRSFNASSVTEKQLSWNDNAGGPVLDSCDEDAAQVGADGVTEGATAYCLAAPITPKSYEVGAGAKIEQTLHDDPNELSYWEEQPYGLVYINYADAESVEKILAAGKRKEVKEGFMAGMAVGNP